MTTPLSAALDRRTRYLKKIAGGGGTGAGKAIVRYADEAASLLPGKSFKRWMGFGDDIIDTPNLARGVRGLGQMPGGRGPSMSDKAAQWITNHPKLSKAFLGTAVGAQVARVAADKAGDALFDPSQAKPTELEMAAFAAAKRQRGRASEEAAVEAAAKAKSRADAEATKNGKDSEGRLIPGVDNTLTAAAGGGIAGAGGGYLLAKKLGWDPVTSSLIGGAGTATAAAILASYMKGDKAAPPKA